MDWINVLSLFDWMSCGMVALERAGIKVNKYYASEIDKYAIHISQKNYPQIQNVGDVTKLLTAGAYPWFDYKIDLLIWGSPCQWFSFAGKQLNFDDPRSKLFFEYVRILKEVKPKYFLLENVVMKQEFQDVISEHLGVEPVMLNSCFWSAQNRKRLYRTNIPWVEKMAVIDKWILLRNIALSDVEPIALHNIYGWFAEKSVRVFEKKSPTIRTAQGGGHIPSFVKKWVEKLILSSKEYEYMQRSNWERSRMDMYASDIQKDKSRCIIASFFKWVPYNVFKDWDCIRKFDPIECERLQTLPDNYTEWVSNSQRYKMIGNGWTVDVIASILSHMPLSDVK